MIPLKFYKSQARQVFANMKAVLAAAGAKMDDVVKITMIIKNGADFPKIGGVRKDFFREPYPASTAFIAPLLNPDWLVEVEAVAVASVRPPLWASATCRSG